MNNIRLICMFVLIALIGACERKEQAAPASAEVTRALPEMISLEALNRGAQLFQEHCAQCHGPEAQGHPDWETPGIVAAPPLDGTGNDWKRSRAELIGSIKKGVKRDGEWIMPAWSSRLSERDITDIVTWFQALWPPEVMASWRKRNTASSAPSG